MPGWLIPLLIVLIVASVGGIGYLLLFQDDDDESTATDDQQDQEDEEEDTEEQPEDEPGVDYDPERLTGTWDGTYECSQGLTGMTLTLDDDGNGNVRAAYEFYPHEDNPAGESGMYHMEGTYQDGQLQLEPTNWAQGYRPQGYRMSPLEADLSEREDTEVIEGEIPTDTCGAWQVERTSPDPWYTGTWQGIYNCNQGRTGITAEIAPTGQDTVEATMSFYQVEGSVQEIPDLSYVQQGTYEDFTLHLPADTAEWVEPPPGNWAPTTWRSAPETNVHPYLLVGGIEEEGCDLFAMNPVEDGESEGEGSGEGSGEDGGEDSGSEESTAGEESSS